MARRAVSRDSSDSHKENTGLPRTNGSSKSSTERVARGKRAVMRDHIEAEDEHEQDREDEQSEDEGAVDADGEANGAEDEDDGEQSPKGRKRARANTMGDSRPSGSATKAEKRTLPRDADGFIPGSIVRIQLRNFLTYDFVEFKPGPYLNMIFGPNGTGKSSIACAICLGLNFPPSLLNRAQELKSFVKNDKTEGHIEIELKGAKGKPNLVIRRMLHCNQKTAPFTLNGKTASGKEINARMAELNVQVSNLCAFLPQDRVAEFARMTPQQLLRETQRAAGNENLTSWHDTLISSGKELRQIQDLVDNDRDQLKTMEERNANLERDVLRYKERQALEKRIELLELIVPFKEYYDSRDKYRELKPKYKKVTKEFRRLQAINAPYMAMDRAMDDELKKRDRARDAKKKAAKTKFKEMGRKWDQNEKLEQEAEELKSELDDIKKSEKDRASRIRRLEKEIDEYEKRLANPPEMEDLDEISGQIKHIALESNKRRQRQAELQEAQQANAAKHGRCRADIDQINIRLQQLDNQKHQKLNELRHTDRDCAEVVEWIRRNANRFRMEVFEPALLCVTVPNKHYVDAVEACFNQTQLRTFVAQCEDDYQLLNKLFVDTPEALGRKVRINTWYRTRDESRLPPPFASEDEIRAMGFDGFAINFIDCPEGLKWFLCSDVKLHRTPLAIARPQAVDPNRTMEVAARSNNASYIVGRVMNVVNRSRYGQRLAQNRTAEIRQARQLAYARVDPQIKQGLEMQLADAQTNIAALEKEENELSVKDREIQAEFKAQKEASEALGKRRDVVQDTQRKIQSAKLKLSNTRQSLQREKNAPSADVKRKELRQKLMRLAVSRVTVVRDYMKLMKDSIKDQDEMTKEGLEFLQVSANKAALENMCKEQKEQIDRAQLEWQEIREKYATAKDESMEKMAVSKSKFEECDEDTKAKFNALEGSGEIAQKPVDTWQAELDQGREELEMNMATNANVVEQYNKRKAEIEALTAVVEEREERMARIQQAIQTARDNWQPALEKLVTSIGKKFSAAFDRIGCAGEIRIHEDEDYEKWAIDIMVKFRDSEKLQLLTGERQSGGERSLTTILYLMSLTEEARAPFSLVDEINQGMDQRAERAVHNSLVEVTCQPDSGQYFLITPKLLPDLAYHARMRILCVNNGEWLPEERGMGNMNGLIDNFLKFRRERANASA